jgi:signal transduction histidine kinase
MLGRQQIAGIGNAISELFKNAHDAYASRVEADFFRWDQTLVLRDDGIGMSPEDFETRWLTLGTESKLGAGALTPPAPPPGVGPRPLLGEKGIGRLAIAAIGPQVLVMTRGYSEAGTAPLLFAFVNWGLFEIPGIRLDEIPVPMAVLESGAIPAAADVERLVAEIDDVVTGLHGRISTHEEDRIRSQLHQFAKVDPVAIDDRLGEPSLTTGTGTHFIIRPTDELLPTLIAEPADRYRTSVIRKSLIGFTNSMGADADVIVPAFRDHQTKDSSSELIGGENFFNAEEFASADHHIEGVFDEHGQFRGTVTVYGMQPVDHVIAWPGASGRPVACGPFRLRLAVVQGERRNSLLPPEAWSSLTRKLNKIGGLYVYRNGVRVLPYGDSDFDWVDIEFRRTKSASYYYFSYRRIFGYIDIDVQANRNLVEKAGREGFRENRAYRDFREILANFFIQIAADFFREGGPEANAFEDMKADLDRQEKIRQDREKGARKRRAAFEEQLANAGRAINEGVVEEEVAATLDRLSRELAAAATLDDQEEIAREFMAAERRARRELIDVRSRYRVTTPRGFAIPRAVRRELEGHRVDWQQVEAMTLAPAAEMIEAALTEATLDHVETVGRRRRLEEAIADAIEDARLATREGDHRATEAAEEVQRRVRDLKRSAVAELAGVTAEIQTQVASIDVASLTDEEFISRRAELEDRVIDLAERQRTMLLSIAEQLATVHWGGDDGAAPLEVADALEAELLALQERADEDLELAQLGMAVGVINHEFDASIRAVRANLRRLKSWAEVNEPLLKLYRNLRASFDHLDGYLTLFTPLQRRLYRERVTITGAEVEVFLRELFARRLERHDVTLTATKAFRAHQIDGYPSTFYPVFVNLLDNAIFWLSDASLPRTLRLDSDGQAMFVDDNGPGIPDRDREVIFERGFTRRAGGQGLGLHIARAVLEKEGYSLSLRASESGASFVIAPATTGPTPEGPELESF